MRRCSVVSLALCVTLIAGCVPRTAPPVEPTPPPEPAPPPPSPPPPAMPPSDWTLAPLTPGDWAYAVTGGGATATFGSPGAWRFEIGCSAGQIRLTYVGGNGGLTVRTTFGERRLPAAAEGAGAMLAASDPLLDQIVFSRGRFMVQAGGGQPLIIPAWPEPARVIEDCRP